MGNVGPIAKTCASCRDRLCAWGLELCSACLRPARRPAPVPRPPAKGENLAGQLAAWLLRAPRDVDATLARWSIARADALVLVQASAWCALEQLEQLARVVVPSLGADRVRPSRPHYTAREERRADGWYLTLNGTTLAGPFRSRDCARVADGRAPLNYRLPRCCRAGLCSSKAAA